MRTAAAPSTEHIVSEGETRQDGSSLLQVSGVGYVAHSWQERFIETVRFEQGPAVSFARALPEVQHLT